MTGFILTDLLLYLYIVALPGAVLTHLYIGADDPLERLAVGITLGIFLVPLVCFGIAMIFSTNIHPTLLFSVATALWAGPLSFRRWQSTRA